MRPRTVRRLKFGSQLAIGACLFTIVAIEYVRPFAADLYFRDEYRRLTAQCDQAMHDEAALRPGTPHTEIEPRLVLSGIVGLTICHDYDKLRKRMLILGVSEEQLALHGLEALESEQIPVSRMIAPHKLDRF